MELHVPEPRDHALPGRRHGTRGNADQPFLHFPVYSIGTILLKQPRFATGAAPLIGIHDLRPQPTDTQPAALSLEGCTVQSTAPAVIAVTPQDREIRRALTLRSTDNTHPAATPLMLPADLRTGWRME